MAGYRLIQVTAGPKTPKDRVALYDVHPDHPPSPGRPDGGEIWITANEPREPHTVAETPDVLLALRDERLQRWEDFERDHAKEARAGKRAVSARVDRYAEAEKRTGQVFLPDTAARRRTWEDDEDEAEQGTRGVDKWSGGGSATPGSEASHTGPAPTGQGKESDRIGGANAPSSAGSTSGAPGSSSTSSGSVMTSGSGATSATQTTQADIDAQRAGGQPQRNPLLSDSGDRLTVPEVRERIGRSDASQLDEIERYENDGEKRSGVLEAVQRRRAELAAGS